MGLRFNNWRKYLPKAFFLVFVVIVGLGFLKVFFWEKQYYQSKTGSRRNISSTTEIDPAVEKEISEGEKESYTVAPNKPRYLTIPKLGVQRARILEVGILKNGELGTPVSIFDAGWYRDSSKPGGGKTVLLDGHNGGPTKDGIFKKLHTLKSGDLIAIERGDGTIFNYQVFDNRSLSIRDADDFMFEAQTSPQANTEALTIITCTGEWSEARQTYLSRQFLRALLVSQSTSDSATKI